MDIFVLKPLVLEKLSLFSGVWNDASMHREKPNPYSAGIDFSRQNLTSVDVRFWRLKSIPAL